MTEQAQSTVVPMKDARPKQGAKPPHAPRATTPTPRPATVPAIAERSAELVREQARLAQIEADLSLLSAELDTLGARKRELEIVAQASRAKIIVLEEASEGGAS